MREKMRAHLGNKHRVALISKPMKAELPISNLLLNSGVALRSRKTEVNALVRQRAILELLAQNDIMEEQEAMALTVLTRRCAMNFIIWHYRNCRPCVGGLLHRRA